MVAVGALGGPDGASGDEDGQEAVPSGQLRHSVGQEGRAERDEALPVLGQPQRPRARPEEQPAEQLAHQQPDQHTDGAPVTEVLRHPGTDPLGGPAAARGGRQPHGRVRQREREPVVQTRLAGQGEPYVVLVVFVVRGLAHPYFRGEHRVGGREDGPQQQRGGRWPVEQPPGDRCGDQERQRHGDTQQSPGRTPPTPPDGPVQRQPRTHQRDNDHDLGDVLGHHPVVHRVDRGQRQGQQVHGDAAQQEDQRHRQRSSGQDPGQYGGEQRADPQPREDRVRARHQYNPPFPPPWTTVGARPGAPGRLPPMGGAMIGQRVFRPLHP